MPFLLYKIYIYHWDLSDSGSIRTDRRIAEKLVYEIQGREVVLCHLEQ